MLDLRPICSITPILRNRKAIGTSRALHPYAISVNFTRRRRRLYHDGTATRPHKGTSKSMHAWPSHLSRRRRLFSVAMQLDRAGIAAWSVPLHAKRLCRYCAQDSMPHQPPSHSMLDCSNGRGAGSGDGSGSVGFRRPRRCTLIARRLRCLASTRSINCMSCRRLAAGRPTRTASCMRRLCG